MPKKQAQAEIHGLKSYTIATQAEKSKAIADAILPVSVRRNVLSEDVTSAPRPSLRIRVAESCFIQFFDVTRTKMSLQQLETVTRDIFASQVSESSVSSQLIVVAFTTQQICLHLGFSTNLVTHEAPSWSSLLDEVGNTILGNRLKDLIAETLKFHQAKTDTATLLAEVLASRNYQRLIDFLSNDLGWGNAEDAPTVEGLTPTGVQLFYPHTDNIDGILVMNWEGDLLGVAQCRLAHRTIKTYTDALSLNNTKISLALVVSGENAILISPARSKDLRVPFFQNRLKERGWVRHAAYLLKASQLPRLQQYHLYDVDALLASRELDERFHALCSDFRLCLAQDLLSNHAQLIVDTLNFFKGTKERSIGLNKLKSVIVNDSTLQSRFLAAIDGLVLRTVVRRFIEVYHGHPFDETFEIILNRNTESYSVPTRDVGRIFDGKSARFSNPRRLKTSQKNKLRSEFLALGERYAARYGGDLHFSRLADAVSYLEQHISEAYLADLLDLTNSSRYEFSYQDLRPDALEHFYQRSLETAIVFKRNRDGLLNLTSIESNQARKSLGAYFTPAVVSSFVIKNTLKKLLEDRSKEIDDLLKAGNYDLATKCIVQFLSTRVVDPNVGGGSFLKQAFREFTLDHWFLKVKAWSEELRPRDVGVIKQRYEWFARTPSQHDYDRHVMTTCLYGVDIDLKSLSVGSQTLALESLSFMDGPEQIPQFIDRNLKIGNSFVDVLNPSDWQTLPSEKIKNLMKARRASILSNKPEIQEAEVLLRREILSNFIQLRAEEWKCDPDQLKPFSWQLEFPEVFYDDDGMPKDNPGFDCVIGNPPWETIKLYEEDFFSVVDPDWPSGKNAKTAQLKRKEKILKNDDTKILFDEFYQRGLAWEQFTQNNSQYIYQNPKFHHVDGTNGDPNTYKLAAERFPSLLQREGVYGFLTPEGIAGDKGTRDLRAFLVDKTGLNLVIGFKKTNLIFPDATQAFVILFGSCKKKNSGLRYKSGLVSSDDLFSVNYSEIAEIDPQTISYLRMETRPLIEISAEIETRILRKLLAPSAPYEDESIFPIIPYRELDTTNDFDLAHENANSIYRICKGEDMGRFQSPEQYRYGLNWPGLKARKRWADRIKSPRVAWRNIAGTMDPRRMIAGIIPANTACFNSLNVIDGPKTDEERHYLCGIINSFCYEYLIRKQSKNNNINIYFLKLNPIIRCKKDSFFFKEVSRLSTNLHKTGDNRRRQKLEVDLECLVASAYGLLPDEFSYIVSTFHRVDESYRENVISCYLERESQKKSS